MESAKTVKKSSTDTTEIRKCRACGLHLNQLPVIDETKMSNVFWVGLSSVLITNEEDQIPLSPSTKSGALIESIEKPYKQHLSFYKTNVVKCLPLSNLNNKIRYPLKNEMEKCYPNLEFEIKALRPSILFLLGKQVANFVLNKHSKKISSFDNEFDYKSFVLDGIHYVPIHHPSFMLVYKRSHIDRYKLGISKYFEEILGA